MKKYYNKGLIYQWFTSTKLFILLGLAVWGYKAYNNLCNNISLLKNNIGYNYSNAYTTVNLYQYAILGVIFIAIHFMSQGINKRNTSMFLTSSPYTKKQIKYNEIFCLMITILLFILAYIYIAFIVNIKYGDLMTIIDGYLWTTVIECIRIFMIGMIGILYMLIVDSLFSNAIVGLISMIILIPFSILCIVNEILNILGFTAIKDGKNIFQILDLWNNYETSSHINHFTLENYSEYVIGINDVLAFVVIQLIIFVIVFTIFKKLQKINNLEFSSNLFTSKGAQKFMKVIVSLGVGCFSTIFITERYINELRRSVNHLPFYGTDLVKVLGAEIACISIASIILYIVIRKILKTVN